MNSKVLSSEIKNMNKKRIITLVSLLIVLSAVIGSYLYYQNFISRGETLPNVNYSPATNEDKSRIDDTKQQAIDRQNIEKENESNSLQAVSPSITYAGQYGDSIEIGAYVEGVFEDGGTCTATMKKDGVTVSKTVTAEKNVRSMDCPVMIFPKSELRSNGTWTVTVSYKSDSAEGKSKDRSVEVK